MSSPWLVLLMAPGMSPFLFGQARTPQAALEELANAQKPDVIERHLPAPVQKSINELPKPQKREVLEKLLLMKMDQLGNSRIRPGRDANAWEIIDTNGNSTGTIRLANVFQSGLDALLSLEIQSDDTSQSFLVAMHLEDDEWRLDDFGPWQRTDLHFRQLVHKPSVSEKNEAAARETLATISSALGRYALQYPMIGYPSRLAVLTEQPGQEPSMDHAGILDPLFAAEPLVKDGYQFRYSLTRTGGAELDPDTRKYWRHDMGEFELIAIPVDFGKTGTKSYFISPGATTRVTVENRPARADDPPADDDDD